MALKRLLTPDEKKLNVIFLSKNNLGDTFSLIENTTSKQIPIFFC